MTNIDLTAITPNGSDDPETAAAKRWLRRREREEHPKGTFDKGGRFYLDDCERFACCAGLRHPSRAHPYPQMTHGRSMEHCASMEGVDAKAAARIARLLDPRREEREAAREQQLAELRRAVIARAERMFAREGVDCPSVGEITAMVDGIRAPHMLREFARYSMDDLALEVERRTGSSTFRVWLAIWRSEPADTEAA